MTEQTDRESPGVYACPEPGCWATPDAPHARGCPAEPGAAYDIERDDEADPL